MSEEYKNKPPVKVGSSMSGLAVKERKADICVRRKKRPKVYVFKQKYSEIPWKDTAGMRGGLIHFYFGIRYDIVWNTIKQEIPVVKPLCFWEFIRYT